METPESNKPVDTCQDATAKGSNMEDLAKCMVSLYQPPLEESKDHINELLNGQERLLKIMEQENSRFKECEYTYNIPELMQQVRVYQGKLTRIKKQMTNIHDRCVKLKRRSLRLKEQTEARAERSRQDKLRAQQREEQLVARFAGAGPLSRPDPGAGPAP